MIRGTQAYKPINHEDVSRAYRRGLTDALMLVFWVALGLVLAAVWTMGAGR